MSARALAVGKHSIAEILYAKDSIVVCRACGKPLYRLTRSIFADDKPGDSTAKYAPVTMADISVLLTRRDLEPGQRAAIKAMSLSDLRAHCDSIKPLTKDCWDDCPACHKPFAFGFIDADETSSTRFGDKGFVIALAVIPPANRGRQVAH